MRILSFLAISILLWQCNPATTNQPTEVREAATSTIAKDPGPFVNSINRLDDYWYQGKGEVSVYELSQNRYNALHPGEAILIFVSEDFLTDKQVKNDQYQSNKSTSVFKLNAIQRFTTGLYDYSLMTSVFTPVKTGTYPKTLKVTNGGQDWCGQVYSQLNYDQESDQYAYQLHSYFENEADQSAQLAAVILEDELLSRIRMSGGEGLPTGKQQLIPSMNFLRLRHQVAKAYTAELSVANYSGDEVQTNGMPAKVYTLRYPEFQREVQYVFQAEAPHYILGWTDAYPSAFDGKIRQTVAQRKTTILEPYWQMNQTTDQSVRDKVGLSSH